MKLASLNQDLLVENVLTDLMKKAIGYASKNLGKLAEHLGIQNEQDLVRQLTQKASEYDRKYKAGDPVDSQKANQIADKFFETIIGAAGKVAKTATVGTAKGTAKHLQQTFSNHDLTAAIVAFSIIMALPTAIMAGTSVLSGGLLTGVVSVMLAKLRNMVLDQD